MPAKPKTVRKVKPAPKSTIPTKKLVAAKPASAALSKTSTKLDQIIAALRKPNGASLAALMALTAWQAHSVRGAISGALKTKRGLIVESYVDDGVRHYRIGGKV